MFISINYTVLPILSVLLTWWRLVGPANWLWRARVGMSSFPRWLCFLGLWVMWMWQGGADLAALLPYIKRQKLRQGTVFGLGWGRVSLTLAVAISASVWGEMCSCFYVSEKHLHIGEILGYHYWQPKEAVTTLQGCGDDGRIWNGQGI